MYFAYANYCNLVFCLRTGTEFDVSDETELNLQGVTGELV